MWGHALSTLVSDPHKPLNSYQTLPQRGHNFHLNDSFGFGTFYVLFLEKVNVEQSETHIFVKKNNAL